MRDKKTIVISFSLALSALFLGRSMFAQESKTPAKPAEAASKPEEKKNYSVVNVTAKSSQGDYGDKKTLLLKIATFTIEDTIINSDEVIYDKNAQTAVSPSVLKISNPECDVKGSKGITYFKKKMGVVEGNVVMLFKPKKEDQPPADTNKGDDEFSADKFRQPTNITCDKMEYFYAKKIANATGSVVFKQPKRVAYSDKAVYDQNKELLTLTGNVHGSDENGTFKSGKPVTISLKRGSEWMFTEEVESTFKIDTQE